MAHRRQIVHQIGVAGNCHNAQNKLVLTARLVVISPPPDLDQVGADDAVSDGDAEARLPWPKQVMAGLFQVDCDAGVVLCA